MKREKEKKKLKKEKELGKTRKEKRKRGKKIINSGGKTNEKKY